MGQLYTAKQKDYLSKIAKKHGFAKWRTIYDHPENKDFREKRKNSFVLYPGDSIFIPTKKSKEVTSETEKKITFKVKLERVLLQLEIRDPSGGPLAMAKYELKTKGDKAGSYLKKREYDSSAMNLGIVREYLSTDEDEGELKIWLSEENKKPDYTFSLDFGALDPVEENTGIQERLRNMGYDCGEETGGRGEKTQASIKDFQEEYGLESDGKMNDITREKIKSKYGC